MLKYLKYEQKDRVALIEMKTPKTFASLSEGLIKEMNKVLSTLDNDPSVKAFVITGSDKEFESSNPLF